MKGYVLYLSFANQTIEYPLYAVDDTHVSISLYKVGIEGYIDITLWDGNWIFEENKYFDIYVRDVKSGKTKMVSETAIRDNGYVLFKAKEGNAKFTVLSIVISEDYTTYIKYVVPDSASITVGSDVSNTISIPSNMVSREQCEITVSEGEAYIEDKNSKYGTIVNSIKIPANQAIRLNPLDTIMLSGYKIIYMGTVIAVNKATKVKCKLNILTSLNAMGTDDIVVESDMFVRSPRLIQPFDTDAITIEAPPNKKESDEMPAIFTYGPSITMPMPMLFAAFMNITVNNRGVMSYLPILCSMGLSAILGVCWAVARNKWKKKKDIADEEYRVQQYSRYIQQNVDFITEKESFNINVLESQFLPTEKLLLCLNGHRELIWNRNVNHKDFLTIRLGEGTIKNYNFVKGPDERFSLKCDDLLELPHQVVEEHKYIHNAPVTLDLKDINNKIIGIIGDYDKVVNVTKQIILQTAALCSYSDVKICVLYNEDEGVQYDWVRWLPHTFTADKKLRLMGSTPETKNNIINYLLKELESRKTATEASTSIPAEKLGSRYIVVITSDKIFEGNQLSHYISIARDLGMTFILAFSTLAGIPNECKALIECTDDFSGYYRLDEARDETAEIVFDTFPAQLPEWFARRMSGLCIKEIASGEIPNSIDYLSMIGIGKLEQWDLERKYRENHAYDSIRALIGLGSSGKEVYLDLHEKRHGPHGLVAGTTGSGKSETLQTAILSWMLNYSPKELAFVLIDYKGGGMANLFAGVPHLAGTITNISDDEETSQNTDKTKTEESEEEEEATSLDDSQTRRALTAIKAEIKYRQGIFRDYKVNHIDAYMKLYQKKKAEVPLPHLIMISDEFAELKKEQPEFIKELVSAARVGRSLGIHLILATQKPGNSVDDEIWANSRFKICLRVQDRADSMSMLKRPEAASITRTGRGLFQLGNNEIFEEFQSGWSGADYEPKDKIASPEDNICTMIELDGTDTPIEVERKVRSDDTLTQLEACVEYIKAKAEELGIQPVRQLWPPQLTKKMYLEQLMRTNTVNRSNSVVAFFGMIDDPEKQIQYPATMNFSSINNLLICGSQGMGKSTLLQTMLYSLVSYYTPEQLNYYLIDFSSNSLKLFNKLRFCGGYITEDDEAEKIQRLFQLLHKIIDERKELFEEHNVGNFYEYTRKNTLPVILIVIDNYIRFMENFNDKNDNLLNDFTLLTREGTKCGIQFVITINKTNEIRGKQKANFLNAIGLYEPEKSEYRDIFSVAATFVPPNYRGRGLFLVGKKLLEYHTALPVEGVSEAERNETLISRLAEVAKRNEGFERAVAIPLIPKDETYKQFVEDAYISKTKMPVGYNTVDISKVYVDFNDIYCYSFSDNTVDNAGISIGLRNVLYFCNKTGTDIDVIKLSKRVSLNTSSARRVITTPRDAYLFLREVEQEVFKRIQEKNEFRAVDKTSPFAPVIWGANRQRVVLIDNLPDLLTACNSEMAQQLDKEPENAKLGKLIKDLEIIFKNGSDYGIYFIAGVPSSDLTADIARWGVFKEFTAYGTAQHFGGGLNNVKTFKFTGSLSAGSAIYAKNIAVVNNIKGMTTIHVPEYLD